VSGCKDGDGDVVDDDDVSNNVAAAVAGVARFVVSIDGDDVFDNVSSGACIIFVVGDGI
jgi:hypothetical protein